MDLTHILDELKSALATQPILARLICGAIAGCSAKSVIAPAERVKMSFQISKDLFTLGSAIERGINMAKTEGFRSLWKGHSTTILRVAPYAGLQFAIHDYMEHSFLKFLDDPCKLPTIYKFAAGAIGGSVATLFTYPLDVLRVRLALTPNATYKSAIQKGGLMRGLGPTLIGVIPYSGTAWCVKQTLTEWYIEYYSGSIKTPELHVAVVLNGMAGIAGQFVTYPLDIIRRRMQMAEKDVNLRHVLTELYTTEGYRGLFKGFSMNIIKGPVAISVSMTVYDLLMQWIHDENIRF
jgi:solute carrier family 25, member 42